MSNDEVHERRCNIANLFKEAKAREPYFLRISAPMVRYSKLEFRRLLRKHGVELCFTPMIIADSFIRSEKARQNEFTTTGDDRPIIAQFAAKNSMEFQYATELIYPYVDGVDLNCGCPQSWAINKGYGCSLLKQPDLVKDIVLRVRRIIGEEFSVSVKIRLLNGKNSKSTVEFARQLERCGVTFINLHSRTQTQKSSDPLNLTAIQNVKQAIQIPLVANGGVRTWKEACSLYHQTMADGIMVARGLLSNPALFNPAFKNLDYTPYECFQDWLDISTAAGSNLQFMCFHHHLTFMCSGNMKKESRQRFNSFTKHQQIYDFFKNVYNMVPSRAALKTPIIYRKCLYRKCSPFISLDDMGLHDRIWDTNSTGKFFNEFKCNLEEKESKELCMDNFDLANSFFVSDL